MSRVTRTHADLLTLIEPSGLFLTVPVLSRVFPDGLERADTAVRVQLRARLEVLDHDDPASRTAWVRWVLSDLLAYAPRLKQDQDIPETLTHVVAEHGVVLRPDYVVIGPSKPGDASGQTPRLLVQVVEHGAALDKRLRGDRWAASHTERMTLLCRATGCRLGLLTDGQRWTLVWAPPGQPGGHGTFDVELFSEEPTLLDGFQSLLGARRLFSVKPGDHLEALFEEASSAEEEVTAKLGQQVRAATELLVAAFSRADRESGGELLADVEPGEVYEAALTVMMRLVFLLATEERGLLPAGDDLYASSYAASTLREELRAVADLEGDEPLEHRHAAWHRLLATFRAVHGGLSHAQLRIPAYGGGLFDPDRFPFLEGRQADEPWRRHLAAPLPVDDRTVLEILDALQMLQFRHGGVTEARRLSYRSLDVEQIGHVYEGLLDHSAVRTDDVAVGLAGARGSEPELALSRLETLAAEGRTRYLSGLEAVTGYKPNQLEKRAEAVLDAERQRLLLAAVDNDQEIFERVLPFAALLRDDIRGMPTVFLPGAVYVTETSQRRETGTEYTNRELADEVARYALEPLVYEPGPTDEPHPANWTLKSPTEILALKVCDPAVGSGAIIVAACRYLADRLVEAWTAQRADGIESVFAGQEVPTDPDELALFARRAVADRCLYGVDRNPLAVEMAKLSLWLVTMARERPFTFLDHAFKAGDSLLGVTSMEQVEYLHLDPAAGRKLHNLSLFEDHYSTVLKPLIDQAVELRRRLADLPLVSVRDAEEKGRLSDEAQEATETLRVIADVVAAAALSTATKAKKYLDERLKSITSLVTTACDPDGSDELRNSTLATLRQRAQQWLDEGRPEDVPPRRPLHWPLEYPEVLVDGNGFSAFVGNPPFLGGKRISGPMGNDFREYLVRHIAGATKGNADLVSYFFLRAASLTKSMGFLATNTIAQGDTREVGLDRLLASSWVCHRAAPSTKWPGSAVLEIAKVWLYQGSWDGRQFLDERPVTGITSSLQPEGRATGRAFRLRGSADQSYIGFFLRGDGFVLDWEEAHALVTANPESAHVVLPFLNGRDLNESPTQAASRAAIDLSLYSLTEAERNHPQCLAILRERVFPVRQEVKQADHRKRWWQFANTRPGLRAATADLKRVIVISAVSKFILPAFVPSKQVFSHALVVFTREEAGFLALLTSSPHWCWVVQNASTMRTDIRYTPTDCFETFPQPRFTDGMNAAGNALDGHRSTVMESRQLGLTKLYNLVHDAGNSEPDIVRLRELHVEVDQAVAEAYGWDDLDLDHGHHDTGSQGIRWTIGPDARHEILDRLLELNHDRHAAEIAAGADRGAKTKKRSRAASALPDGQGAFPLDAASEQANS